MMSAPASRYARWIVGDHVRAGEHQQVVVALEVARPVGEALAAVVAPRRAGASGSSVPMAPSRMRMRSPSRRRNSRTRSGRMHASGSGHGVASPAAAGRARGRSLRQLRAIQRVEMELVDAVSAQAPTCSMATVAAISLRVSGSSSRPSKRCAIQCGTLAPQRGEARHLREVRDRHDARHDSARRCPPSAHWSRKRRKTSRCRRRTA